MTAERPNPRDRGFFKPDQLNADLPEGPESLTRWTTQVPKNLSSGEPTQAESPILLPPQKGRRKHWTELVPHGLNFGAIQEGNTRKK